MHGPEVDVIKVSPFNSEHLLMLEGHTVLTSNTPSLLTSWLCISEEAVLRKGQTNLCHNWGVKGEWQLPLRIHCLCFNRFQMGIFYITSRAWQNLCKRGICAESNLSVRVQNLISCNSKVAGCRWATVYAKATKLKTSKRLWICLLMCCCWLSC